MLSALTTRNTLSQGLAIIPDLQMEETEVESMPVLIQNGGSGNLTKLFFFPTRLLEGMHKIAVGGKATLPCNCPAPRPFFFFFLVQSTHGGKETEAPKESSVLFRFSLIK